MFSRRKVLFASAALLGSSWAAFAATSRNILQLRVEYTATSLIGTEERTVPGARELTDLELYLAWRAQGLPIEAPGVRR